MTNWSEIIETHRAEVVEALCEAHRDSLESPHMQFTVYIHADGDIEIGEDLSGGNSFPEAVFNGDAVKLASYDSRGSDVLDYTEDGDVVNGIMRQLEDGELNEATQLLEGVDISEQRSVLTERYPDAVEACRKELIDFYADEYEREGVDEQIDSRVRELRQNEGRRRDDRQREDAR